MIKSFRFILLGVSVALMISSCKKTEEVIIEGNQAPPDHTIENVIKENYVNKLYISLLGRKATEDEYNEGLAIIDAANLSISSRAELISLIQEKGEYHINEYEIARAALINGSDTSDITLWIAIIDGQLAVTSDPEYIEQLQTEKDRLVPMTTIVQDLNDGVIDLIDAHKYCVDNLLYDEINMGTENFVVSLYQNFFFRYPTSPELEQGSLSIDNFQAINFYQITESKSEYIDAFFGSEEYFEGQVRDLYLRYLFREPSSEEMSSQATIYKDNLEFKSIQSFILSTDEYVGI